MRANGLGQPGGRGVPETQARPRLPTPSPHSNGGAHRTGPWTACHCPPLFPSALSPSWIRSRDRALLAGAVGRRGRASVQARGRSLWPCLGAPGSLCKDREAGRQAPQASRPLCATLLRGGPAPAPTLSSSHSPYPPNPHPTAGTLRSHTSSHPCPGARQPLAHPWTAPWLPCPRHLHPRPPRQ